MNEPVAYINGQWIPAAEASISVDDSGFILGASVAEQLRTFGGKLFRLSDHIDRLIHSLGIVGVDPGMGRDEIASIAEQLAERNHRLLDEGNDLRLSIVVTPGIHPAYGAHVAQPPSAVIDNTTQPRAAVPQEIRPTVCLHTHPLAFHLWADNYRTGQTLVATQVRQVPDDCWPAALKCRSRMHYYLADREAAATEPGARALLLDAEGFVTEASTANLLLYRKSEGLISPPEEKILPGISLSTVAWLARAMDLNYVERDLTVEDVLSADEAMLTSTSTCILPAVRLNGRPIGDGKPGAIFSRLLAAWSRMAGVDIAAQAERFAEMQ